jgi:hypothetical protein
VAGREERVRQIEAEANRAALEHLQEYAGFTRTDYHGRKVDDREPGRWERAGLVVTTWLQGTSRDGEPHEPADVVTDRISVPHRAPQQPLHRLRIIMTGLLRQPPAVLAFHRRQQPQHKLPGCTPRLCPGEPARDQEHQLIEQFPPASGVYAVASGHRIIIGRPHNPA